MKLKSILLALFTIVFLLALSPLIFAQDDVSVAPPAGEDDNSYSETEPANSYRTTQTIGNAPGMDEYRWFDQDFGWTHTFDACCKTIKRASLRIRAWDVDMAGGEVDKVYADGVCLGDLEGQDDEWSTTTFDLDPALLEDGTLEVWVDIDAMHEQRWWAVTIDWSRLVVYWDWNPPVADFTAEPLIGVAPMTVKFTNLSKCAVAWKWDFGDGSEISTEKDPIHTYLPPTDPIFTVTLTAYNPDGVEDTMVKEDYITCYLPIVLDFNSPVNIGVGELFVNFENLATGTITDYFWEVNDSIFSIEKDSFHKFGIGNFNISLTAWGPPLVGKHQLTREDFVIVYDPASAPVELKLVESSASYYAEPWANVLDKDFWGWDGTATIAAVSPAYAIFKCADDATHLVDKVRMITDTGTIPVRRWLQDFQVAISKDNVTYRTVLDTCKTGGGWEVFAFEADSASYIKLTLLSPMDAEWIQIGELEVWEAGKAPMAIPPLAKQPEAKPEQHLSANPPANFVLSQNYPNPFNPETSISYQIPNDTHVSLAIYNMTGKLIRTLVSENKSAGAYTVCWNGLDNAGQKVASGIYVYRLEAAGCSVSKKMAMLK
ncbi:MAG: PKD domain-containing protein [candidate division KSB1 bacterium]|nr:PKD domain-containing protein [candidate division KSB1 bacterium]MDZ7341507.1 PKD domain-containing protein [candidate division KSB1 bacterium]